MYLYKMEELLEKAKLKNIPFYEVLNLLHKHGWELFIQVPAYHNPEHFKDFGKKNKQAVEKALIEIDNEEIILMVYLKVILNLL